MDLPTYTSIWRIEKRLYKLYDFRLPMPLPIGQITVFAAITVPYLVLLTLLGLPFNHTLIWLYVLPPGVATWLVTRPVLEGKRLPELIKSHVRYLAEPRVWCRMVPLAESDVIVVSGRVWRLPPAVMAKVSSQPSRQRTLGRQVSAPEDEHEADAPDGLVSRRPRRGVQSRPVPVMAVRVETGAAPVTADQPAAAGRQRARGYAGPPGHRPGQQPAPGYPPGRGSESPGRQLRSPTAPPTRPGRQAPAEAQVRSEPAPRPSAPHAVPPPAALPTATPPPDPAAPVPAAEIPAAEELPGPRQAGGRPTVTVVNSSPAHEAPLAVEQALAGPSARRSESKAGRVTVVPGGHRPGKPDQLARDRTRAQQPLGGRRSVVVLGCTVGAGQTITTLMIGEVLASLRSDPVAVLDLNPSAESLAVRSLLRPALGQAASLGPSRLTVLPARPDGGRIDSDRPGASADPDLAAAVRTFEEASAGHQIVLADPSTSAVPRLLTVTDQLVLVAPASTAAARAIGMTFEWLDAHGQADLAADAIMVMNGVSRRSMPLVEGAERVAIGRCRAIVRVPWDDQLRNQQAKRTHPATAAAPASQQWAGLLSPATVSAYTALAGVLVASLTGHDAGQPGEQVSL